MKILIRTLRILFYVVVFSMAGYIMFHGLGLDDSLDFGAGAYYYADIPHFEKYVNSSYYTSPVPMWALILLFLVWGFLVYRLWGFLEKKMQNRTHKSG